MSETSWRSTAHWKNVFHWVPLSLTTGRYLRDAQGIHQPIFHSRSSRNTYFTVSTNVAGVGVMAVTPLLD